MTANTSALKEKIDATRQASLRTAEAAGEAAREAGKVVAEGVSEGAEAAKAAATDAFAHAREGASRQLDSARDAISETADKVAETLRNAAEQARSGPMQAGLMSALSGGVATAAKGLRDRSLGEIAAEVRGVARRNPALFAVGAGLAGFALARFLLSSQAARPSATDSWIGSESVKHGHRT